MKVPVVYVLANENRTLYIGVTSDLGRRLWQHRNKISEGFTAQYDLWKLVYFEKHESMKVAIMREKQMKDWRRDKKVKLIEAKNPNWADLAEELFPRGTIVKAKK